MKFLMIRCLFISFIMTLLIGCAGQKNIPLAENFWQNKKQKVVVAVCKTPEPQVYKVGQQGLIDVAVNSLMNKDMDKALKQTDLAWYNNIASNFTSHLQKQDIKTSVHSNRLEINKKNEEIFLTQIEGDKVLIIELNAVGARRDYYGFIPTGAPKAYCVLTGRLIDPKDKKVLWRHQAEVIVPVQGAWDQPPNYPNFTNALQLATNEAKQELLDSFFSGR